MEWKNQLTKTPYLVLFIILITVGVGTASALITITLAGDVIIEGDLDMTGGKISNLVIPLDSSDAATKSYVDSREIFLENISLIDSENAGEGGSIALTSEGLPVISYVANGLTELRIAICGNTLCSNKIIKILDNVDLEEPDLVLASGDIPVIIYRDDDLEVLKFVLCWVISCSCGIHLEYIEPSGNDIFICNSLVLGSVAIPVMAYLDATNGNLKLTKCADTTCISPSKTITTIGPALTEITGDVSLKIDSSGNPVVAFIGSSNELRVLTCGNDTCTSGQSNVEIVIENDDIGSNLSLSLAAGDIPIISYTTLFPDRELHLVKCDNKTCTTFIDPVTIVDLGEARDISMDLTTDGLPMISYEKDDELLLVQCQDVLCNTKTIRVLDSLTGNVGVTSIALTSDDLPIISYGDFDSDNLQKLFTFQKGIILE